MAPTSMVQQLIIVHVGGMGFIPGVLLSFKSKHYHKEMNSDNYMQWVRKKLILNLPHNYVFVVDSATYHNVLSEKCPTSSRKEDMKNLLLKNKIPLTGDLLKMVLYTLIKLHKLRYKRYVFDYVWSAHGHAILHLPPQHPDLNVTDHIWCNVKQWVGQWNVTYNLDDVWQL